MARVAVTKKRGAPAKKGGSKLALRKKSGGLPDVTFPDAPSPRKNDIRDFSMLVHGEKKIGKTSMLAQEEGAFFLEFDPLQDGLSIHQRHVPDWAHFLAYTKLAEEKVEAGTFKYRTVILDGIDLMYKYCFAYWCKKMGIEHPHDENDFGKSWNTINGAFREGFLRWRNLPGVAIRLLCHSKWAPTKTRGGHDTEKLVPTLTASAEEAIVADIDIWAAYTYDGSRRVLVVVGDERTGAGHRIEHKFRSVDGRMVEEIDLGGSPQESYESLLAAFDNQQTYSTIDELREQGKLGTARPAIRTKPAASASGGKLKLKVRKRS